ncbi:MAG: histidine kinase [Eggerthellaceae bacterium]|nr:histidine kinase [Eggerthellaceae bacterium]
MITDLDFFITALIDGSGILFGVFGLVLVYLAREVNRWPRGLCVAILLTTIARTAYELVLTTTLQAGSLPELLPIMRVLMTIMAPIPFVLVFAFFLWCCGEDWRKSTSMRILAALTVALIVAGIAAQLAGRTGVASGEGAHANPLSVVAFILVLAMSAFFLIALFRRWGKLTNLQRVLFLACFLAPASIQTIPIELLLLSDLVQHYLQQKEESAQQRARVAVLQMRPHFIHNTLASIYYLIAKDPKKAQQTTRDFSRYLQNNLEAIAQEGTIPFEKELEHTRAYLAVEQACYEGRVFVEFDTPVTSFNVVPLMLQPIVENAVKHGMDPDSKPLQISIATRNLGRGVQITVEDNGPGFMPHDGEGQHFALDNVRERLKTKCGGTMQIEALQSGGTRVTIFVPRKESVELAHAPM